MDFGSTSTAASALANLQDGPDDETPTFARVDSSLEANTQDQHSKSKSKTSAGFKVLDKLLDFPEFKVQLSDWAAAQELAKKLAKSSVSKVSIESGTATVRALSLLIDFWALSTPNTEKHKRQVTYLHALQKLVPDVESRAPRSICRHLRMAKLDAAFHLPGLSKNIEVTYTLRYASSSHVGLKILRDCVTRNPLREQMTDGDSVAAVLLGPMELWEPEQKLQVANACTDISRYLEDKLPPLSQAKRPPKEQHKLYNILPPTSVISGLTNKKEQRKNYYKYLHEFGQSLQQSRQQSRQQSLQQSLPEGISNGNDQQSATDPDSNSASSIPLAHDFAGGSVRSGYSPYNQVVEDPSSYYGSPWGSAGHSEAESSFGAAGSAWDPSQFLGGGAAGWDQPQSYQPQSYQQQFYQQQTYQQPFYQQPFYQQQFYQQQLQQDFPDTSFEEGVPEEEEIPFGNPDPYPALE